MSEEDGEYDECYDCGEPLTKDGHCRQCSFFAAREDDDYPIDGVGFADPGGRSALRAATEDNPRDQPCPSCERKNVLTRLDVRRGYQCDRCADASEGYGP